MHGRHGSASTWRTRDSAARTRETDRIEVVGIFAGDFLHGGIGEFCDPDSGCTAATVALPHGERVIQRHVREKQIGLKSLEFSRGIFSTVESESFAIQIADARPPR